MCSFLFLDRQTDRQTDSVFKNMVSACCFLALRRKYILVKYVDNDLYILDIPVI